ncbi:MAG: helix-turn-helix transcriptional regulator [Thiolinea sp.]
MMNISIKMLQDISTTIRQARRARGLSQQQLADLVSLDRTTIGALERNDYQDLGIRKVERVLAVLGKTLTCEDVGMPTLDDLVKAHERG